MGNIIVRFVAAADFGSGAIREFERGWPSHTGAILTADGDLCELGARCDSVGGKPPGVQIRPADYATFSRTETLTIPCEDAISDKFYAFLNAQLGAPYDKLAIVDFPTRLNWHTPGSWICSGLIFAAVDQSGLFRSSLAMPPEEVTPWEVYTILKPWSGNV